jgi:hypothetical protein
MNLYTTVAGMVQVLFHGCDRSAVGERYYTFRALIPRSRLECLTKANNHLHEPHERAQDVATLHSMHEEMHRTVATAYTWSDSDSDLGHGFHQTLKGLRLTISAAARREVLDRLLALNYQRYAENVARGPHEKGARKGQGAGAAKGRLMATTRQDNLFGAGT